AEPDPECCSDGEGPALRRASRCRSARGTYFALERRGPPMKVLVADDDAVCRLLLHKTLTGWGYEAVAVNDGRAAWGGLQADGGPALVILDWLMPGLDGGELCRLIRERVRDRYTFVLLLTSRRSHVDLLEGLQAGANDYLRKPFDPAELRARLNTGRRILQLQDEL